MSGEFVNTNKIGKMKIVKIIVYVLLFVKHLNKLGNLKEGEKINNGYKSFILVQPL
jgi:hypothetical protein